MICAEFLGSYFLWFVDCKLLCKVSPNLVIVAKFDYVYLFKLRQY